MEQLIVALKNALTAEKDAYAGLLALSERKKDILVNNDVQGLNKLTREETGYIKSIKPISAEREGIIRQIASEKGVKGNLKFDDIIAFTDGRLQDDLIDIKQEFNNVIMQLSRNNEVNKKLIETQLQYTAFCIEVLTQPANAADTYSSNGQVSESSTNRFGLLDQKV